MRASLSLLALPVLAAAGPVVKRDFASINTAIGYISGNTTALDTAVNKLGDNDAIGGIGILIAAGNLNTAVGNAADVTSASGSLNDADSGTLAGTLINLEKQVFALLDDIVAKKPQFMTALLGGDASGLVVFNLKQSQSSTDTFGANLASKLSANFQAAAPTVIGQFDAKFNSTIAAFSS